MSIFTPELTAMCGQVCSRLTAIGRSTFSSRRFRLSSFLIGSSAIYTLLPLSSLADDTELYVYEASARSGARPQMLIIFDNSGSMKTTVVGAEKPYSSNAGGISGDNLGKQNKLYFTRGATAAEDQPNPSNTSETRHFSGVINSCESSWESLHKYGFYTGYFRGYSFTGSEGTWKELDDTGSDGVIAVDCFEDIQDEKWANAGGVTSGLPVDGRGSVSNPKYYTYANAGSTETIKQRARERAELTGFGIGRPLTIYTQDYLTWQHGTKEKANISRLDIAKNAVKSIILTTPSVDFGLAVFNVNAWNEFERDGGRIISGLKENTSGVKSDLIEIIDDIKGKTNTPLCETLYEAYRYFSGLSVDFAYKNTDLPNAGYFVSEQPKMDPSVAKSGIYESPFKKCQNNASVVIITDGVPTKDAAADDFIDTLTGGTDKYGTEEGGDLNYLSALSSWMNKYDLNSSEPGDQTVSTHTIGFSKGAATAAALLKKTAEVGGGRYFDATNANLLQGSLQQVVSEALDTNSSFTSPAVASNNFNRTQSFEYAYYSIFLPNKGPTWLGNLKKYRVTGKGVVVDKAGNPAIGLDGNIKSTACSFWTPSAVCSAGGDGNEVEKGGALSAMQAADSRTIYSNLNTGLTELTVDKVAGTAGGTENLVSYLGVAEEEFPSLFGWAKGLDVDNNKGLETIPNPATNWRDDIMGDALHSKPLALNFGTKSAPDVRIVMGTNHGFLHMFKDDSSSNSVTETWAFIPYELLPNLKTLRANVPTGVHSVYGVDGSPVAYTKTNDSGIEKAWLFFGMRRGGSSYYAIDISDPDNPSFMWKVDASSPGMSELGQSWSTPVVTNIPGRSSENPVLIFGAGYSPSGKDGAGIGADDVKGRGVFILDAETGALVHQFGSASTGGTQLPGISDSIPSSVAVLDSNADGASDRIYATDTGGNVWRMDMPSADTNKWSGFKFASLGGGVQSSDRRFYSAPAVAQTVITNIAEVTVDNGGTTTKTKTKLNIPYDAVVVGSGHRAMPSDLSRSDMFFTLQDRNVVSRSFKGGGSGVVIPTTLTLSNLYDVTSTPPSDSDEQEQIDFGKKRGWYYSFSRAGEKNLSPATIVNGRVFFTSFVPPGDNSSSDQCISAGAGFLYNFDLHRGTRTYNYIRTGEFVPDTPQLIVPPRVVNEGEEAKPSNMYLIGIGAASPGNPPEGCDPNDLKCVGGGLSTNKIYYYTSD
ncbi:pilus assembly protein [Shewanella nanhaiensis]|uniref:rRNA (Guanine-N1)-methyltransferase n=1 Tax=Shewanella nanhaiensis TaxID=2864872 RepID=A0ABS7E3V8_9GAMM|nr:PilC/PilY family type IV pilus protein [Shewanella nanhaiensis]MBW8184373.1 rRNA (guanine-N1)-methyltransferase [Shewanella nanhaiensis]